eukprot:scaffold141247_cov23-Tisochrysis_lutea.AAC.1
MAADQYVYTCASVDLTTMQLFTSNILSGHGSEAADHKRLSQQASLAPCHACCCHHRARATAATP